MREGLGAARRALPSSAPRRELHGRHAARRFDRVVGAAVHPGDGVMVGGVGRPAAPACTGCSRGRGRSPGPAPARSAAAPGHRPAATGRAGHGGSLVQPAQHAPGTPDGGGRGHAQSARARVTGRPHRSQANTGRPSPGAQHGRPITTSHTGSVLIGPPLTPLPHPCPAYRGRHLFGRGPFRRGRCSFGRVGGPVRGALRGVGHLLRGVGHPGRGVGHPVRGVGHCSEAGQGRRGWGSRCQCTGLRRRHMPQHGVAVQGRTMSPPGTPCTQSPAAATASSYTRDAAHPAHPPTSASQVCSVITGHRSS